MSSRRTSSHPAAEAIIDELARCGVREMVLSPGSRSAPLVIAAHHHPAIRLVVALDERAAAHIALGMTLRHRRPVGVLSTSGTAAVNHGPGLAEAHHAGHPLISITADRGQLARQRGHGQTVRQPGLFNPHVSASLDLDESTMTPDEMRALVRDHVRLANGLGHEPLHINVPLDEPLYETVEVDSSNGTLAEPRFREGAALPEGWLDVLGCHAPRVLWLAGQESESWGAEDRLLLSEAMSERVGVLADRLSGWAREGFDDAWIAEGWPEDLAPNIVITTGTPPMSKRLRNAIGDLAPLHLHIGPRPWDIWGRGVSSWPIPVVDGLRDLVEAMPEGNAFAQNWQVQMDRWAAARPRTSGWSDRQVFAILAEMLRQVQEAPAAIHFANSTSARLMQSEDWPEGSRLHANRGVAGIDGCTSTAVGDALQHPERQVVLVTGDTAWLYDLNALHVSPMPKNLRVVVIDNAGGQIFRWLPGPAAVDLTEAYFAAPPRADLEASVAMHGLAYVGRTSSGDDFATGLLRWWAAAGSAVIVADVRGCAL